MGNVAGNGTGQSHRFDVVLIAASAGGLSALRTILSALPADFAAAVAVVLHREPRPSALAELLDASTRLEVREAEEGDWLQPGMVHLAPPGRHLLISADESLRLSDSPKVQFSRPAADRLFESGAESLMSRIIAVVLTGWNQDGSAGVRAVKLMGGRVIVQDVATAEAAEMPLSAMRTGAVDRVLPLVEIAPCLMDLVLRDP
jgi:two-component system chemotaxis response regulator CheB